MSLLSAAEIHVGREGTDDEKSKSRTRTFRVIMDHPYDDADEVLDEFVGIGTLHPYDPTLIVSRRRAAQENFSKVVWIVTLTYRQRDKSENPLDDPIEVSWNTNTAQIDFHYDKDGNAVLNSAGDVYEDGAKDEWASWVATVHRNITTFPAWLVGYENAINSSAFEIDGFMVGVRGAKVKSIAISKWQKRNGIYYRELNMSIAFKTTWVKYLLDQGLRRIITVLDYDVLLPCLIEGGKVEATRPVPLDGSGGQLPLPLADPSDAVFNAHYIFPELPFAPLLS